jgi:hypothetical protein
MELTPREAAFLLDEMAEIQNSDNRLTSEQREAGRIRRKAVSFLTE